MTALVVEDGSGLANAESYASVAEAQAYHYSRGNEDAWDSIEDPEAALRKATDYISKTYGILWAGARSVSTQALDWPRQGVRLLGSASRELRAQDVIPVELKNATAELALKAGQGTDLLQDLGRETLSESVDVIRVTYAPGSSRQVVWAAADGWLRVLLGYSRGMIPMRRA